MLIHAKTLDISFYLVCHLSFCRDHGIEKKNWLINQLIELDWSVTRKGGSEEKEERQTKRKAKGGREQKESSERFVMKEKTETCVLYKA